MSTVHCRTHGVAAVCVLRASVVITRMSPSTRSEIAVRVTNASERRSWGPHWSCEDPSTAPLVPPVPSGRRGVSGFSANKSGRAAALAKENVMASRVIMSKLMMAGAAAAMLVAAPAAALAQHHGGGGGHGMGGGGGASHGAAIGGGGGGGFNRGGMGGGMRGPGAGAMNRSVGTTGYGGPSRSFNRGAAPQGAGAGRTFANGRTF